MDISELLEKVQKELSNVHSDMDEYLRNLAKDLDTRVKEEIYK